LRLFVIYPAAMRIKPLCGQFLATKKEWLHNGSIPKLFVVLPTCYEFFFSNGNKKSAKKMPSIEMVSFDTSFQLKQRVVAVSQSQKSITRLCYHKI